MLLKSRHLNSTNPQLRAYPDKSWKIHKSLPIQCNKDIGLISLESTVFVLGPESKPARNILRQHMQRWYLEVCNC